MTEYSKLVNRYKRFREITRKLHSDIPKKHISKKAFNKCGKKLGLMRNNTLIFGDEQDMAVLMDYCIYDYRENGSNAISRYLAGFPPVPDSDEYVVLKAMSESFYTLIQVEHVLPGVGVQVNDLLGNKQFLLIDMGFSETSVEGVVLATRILPFEDFTMTSGAPLVVEPQTLEKIFDFAAQEFGSEDGEYINFDMRQRVDLTATIIRLCLQAETDTQIEYQDVETEPVTQPLSRETRVGRNEPCPCGSGRKYKRCCGRISSMKDN